MSGLSELERLMEARHCAARTSGFIQGMLEINAIPECHRDQAREVMEAAQAIMKTPLFPVADQVAA